jgi:hypothetical protein
MATLIDPADAQAWLEATKTNINNTLDTVLVTEVQETVLRKIDGTYDLSTCVSPATTPELLRTIIAMEYASRYYARAYSEDNDQVNRYALTLKNDAEALIVGILNGAISLPGVPPLGGNPGSPIFYPTDASSAQCPTHNDPSLGPAAFSMGKVF